MVCFNTYIFKNNCVQEPPEASDVAKLVVEWFPSMQKAMGLIPRTKETMHGENRRFRSSRSILSTQ